MKKISIVTVVYNCEDTIADTIKSVVSQTAINKIEYIIIDGSSTDNTLSEIYKFKDQIDFIVSEKDTGIYNAMNKSLKYVTGEWVLFLNAGDVFENAETIENVLSHESKFAGNDIIGFSTLFKHRDKLKTEKVKELSQRWICVPACHQSMLIRSSVHKLNHYNENFKICADHYLFNKLINNGHLFLGINSILSIFAFDGVSAKNRVQLYKEKLAIANKLHAPYSSIMKLNYLIFRLRITGAIKRYLYSSN